MRQVYVGFTVGVLLCVSVMVQAQNWKLVWQDEFTGSGLVDSTKWSFERGFVRNHEHQWYQKDNAFRENGVLVIEGRKENFPNPDYDAQSRAWNDSRPTVEYSASSICSRGKFSFKYGRIEVRAKIPTASGAWPAIWTLGDSMQWPSCGEIDIMEYYQVKGQPTILANAAWGTNRQYTAKWNTTHHPYKRFTDRDPDWASKFHKWSMDWDSTALRIYLDDELLNETLLKDTYNGSLGEGKNPFMQPHYVLLNLALGGMNGGPIDDSAFPMRYEIDYVRVFQKSDAPKTEIKPGEIWADNEGRHINAHGGGILLHEGRYYWFGEHKSDHTSNAIVGITCYSSDDLVNWKNEGIALPVSKDNSSDIVQGCIMERPKVIYNPKTKKFVMWFHLELKDKGYEAARSAVAYSDCVTGPYHYVESLRPCAGSLPANMTKREYKQIPDSAERFKPWSKPWVEAVKAGLFIKRDMENGQMARDMTLYVDDDGTAYHIYSSEENQTLHIAELTSDYMRHTGKYVRVAPGDHNEAPAIFKRDGVYWMITSDCTGWTPNAARMFRAKSILGPWQKLPNPCVGSGVNTTFDSQSTYILPIQGKDAYIFMGDRWTPEFPSDARYIWLPIQFKNGTPFLEWTNSWSPEKIHQTKTDK